MSIPGTRHPLHFITCFLVSGMGMSQGVTGLRGSDRVALAPYWPLHGKGNAQSPRLQLLLRLLLQCRGRSLLEWRVHALDTSYRAVCDRAQQLDSILRQHRPLLQGPAALAQPANSLLCCQVTPVQRGSMPPKEPWGHIVSPTAHSSSWSAQHNQDMAGTTGHQLL